MRIAINLLYLLPGVVGGTETYAAGLLHGLAQLDSLDEFIVFVNQEGAEWLLPPKPNFTRVICPVRAANRARRYFFEQVRLYRLLKESRIDVLHSLGYVGPLFTPCPNVVTVPDLNFIALENSMTRTKQKALRFFSMRSAQRANHVLTISYFSKNEIIRFMNLDPRNITVTLLGPKFCDSPTPYDWESLKRRYCIIEPYIVAFGGSALHKNIPRLIQAYATLKDEYVHKLVLIGHIPANVDLITEKRERGIGEQVITTGFVPDDHILPLLGHADLFVLPSLYEGFGLPLLEAQQAGVAVVSSKAGSLPEVGGDGAIFFNPLSVDEMIQAIRICLEDSELRNRLILKGSDNLARFSWQNTARETLAVYRDIEDSLHKIP